MTVEGTWPVDFSSFLFSFTYLFILLLLLFLTLARMPSRSADWKIGCLLNWRHHRKLGRLQIANLRPEQKHFFSPSKGLLFFLPLPFIGWYPKSCRIATVFVPAAKPSSWLTLCHTHNLPLERRLQRGQTPQRVPLYQNLPCQLGSSFPEPSSDYQCTDGMKITSSSYMNHK